MKSSIIIVGVLAIILIAASAYRSARDGGEFEIPSGEPRVLEEAASRADIPSGAERSDREIFVTAGVKHSIPLDEILSGGPPKDGIPSIDDPRFVSVKKADAFLDDDEPGLAVIVNGDARFYPYKILVWHEIVNDVVGGRAVVITYCPLCRTGIVFDRNLGGKPVEFGVSGKLWRSNLLMYNRTGDAKTESLWSQILGEAVVGPDTGARLAVIPANTVRYGGWKRKYPDTKVLSEDTGSIRPYGTDPYGDYYTSERVSFGAVFDDNRAHPKTAVVGIRVGDVYKAYDADALPVGETRDVVGEIGIVIAKSDIGEIAVFAGDDEKPLPFVYGFWFAWLAAHPDTLFQ